MEPRPFEAKPPQNPVSAVRLIFEYDGDRANLISQIPVEMVIGSLDTAQAEHSSYYVDSRDAAGKTLSRVKAHGAFSSSTEVFPERHGEPIRRVSLPAKKGAFTVVVPTPANTTQVSLMKTAAPSAQQMAAAANNQPIPAAKLEEIASFPLTNPIHKQGGEK